MGFDSLLGKAGLNILQKTMYNIITGESIIVLVLKQIIMGRLNILFSLLIDASDDSCQLYPLDTPKYKDALRLSDRKTQGAGTLLPSHQG